MAALKDATMVGPLVGKTAVPSAMRWVASLVAPMVDMTGTSMVAGLVGLMETQTVDLKVTHLGG
jgi:hypothetical protein